MAKPPVCQKGAWREWQEGQKREKADRKMNHLFWVAIKECAPTEKRSYPAKAGAYGIVLVIQI